MSVLGNNADFDLIESETLQAVIDDPIGSGREFTRFLQNRARMIVNGLKMVITLVATFNPTDFIGKGWTIWKGPANGKGLKGDEDRDVREDSLTEIDLASIELDTCLKDGESRITGEEKLRRLKEAGKIRLGGRAFAAFLLDYQSQKDKSESMLEHLYKTRGVTYLDFMGLILRGPSGGRYVLCLGRDGGGRWRWGYRWLGYDWDVRPLSAGLASK